MSKHETNRYKARLLVLISRCVPLLCAFVLFGGLICETEGASADPLSAENSPALTKEKQPVVLRPLGCNAVAYAPLPFEKDYFIGRQFYDADGSPLKNCRSGDVWGLVIAKLDWEKRQFTAVAPALPTPAVITSGQMKGAVIRSAYDPDMVEFRGKYLASFECAIKNKQDFGIQGISTCVGEYDPTTRRIDLNRTNVVISAEKAGLVTYTASVPHLLSFQGQLYLYWSAVRIQRGRFTNIAVRGVELQRAENGFYWARGAKGLRYSLSPETSEVWAPDPSDPLSDSTVDIRSLWSHHGTIVAMASVGGSGCVNPRGGQPGCYRLRLATATKPLGYHIFQPLPENSVRGAPTNPMGYSRLVHDPDGKWALLAEFFRPVNNGVSEARPALEWNRAGSANAITTRPFMFPNLAPTVGD